MRWFNSTAAMSWLLAAAAAAPASHASPLGTDSFPTMATRDVLNGICPRNLGASNEEIEAFGNKLSDETKIYFPGSEDFEKASTRWSNLELPQISIVIVPATENDVAETIKFANKFDIPFLAFNGAHGATTTLGKMKEGIEIYLEQLTGVDISEDGKTATIGGGTNSKVVTDTLWNAGKQTVTGTCECVSYMGPALGGGHGWLQGHHGLLADQWVSMNVVLADGSIETLDADSDLMWAMKGAGHNFGIVTSVTTKIYDIEHSDWAIETFIFDGDKVGEVYDAANKYLSRNGNQPVDVHYWSYWLNIPTADAEKPVIMLYLIQEGGTSINETYSKPLRDIGPISVTPDAGTYRDLAGWTGIALDSTPCQKAGLVNPRFPIYLENYDVPAVEKAYSVYAEGVSGDSPFSNSLFMWESYATKGVRSVDSASTAFAFRDENILAAPLITYMPDASDEGLDARAEDLGNTLRNILHEATGRETYRAYVNYAYGNENEEQLYGSDKWRQCKLRALKKTYDPESKFSFYHPIRI